MRNLVLAAVAMLTLSIVPARASLIGDQLHWDYYAYGSIYQTGATWTVGGTSGGAFPNYFTVNADATSITFDYSIVTSPGPWSPSSLSLSPTINNGIAINLISGGPFTSLSIDGATNMVGFDSSRISFTAKQIQIDWQNLKFDTHTIVKLNVNSTAAVPEPAQAGGLACALMALAFWQRKRIIRS